MPKPHNPRRRSSRAELGLRVNRVARLLANGGTRSDVLQYASTQWECSTRTTDDYIRRAREILCKDWELDRRVFTAELLSQLASLQKEARKTNQLNCALGAINSAARIARVLE